MDRDHIRYFFIILFVAVFYLAFLVIKPFITPLLISMVFAFIFSPVYRWLNNKVKSPSWSAFFVSFLLVIIVSVPAVFLVNAAIGDAQVFYSVTRQKFVSGELFPAECGDNVNGIVCKASDSFRAVMSNAMFQFYLNEALKNVTRFIISSAQNLFLSIPRIVLSLFIIIVTTFFMTRDGESIVKRIKNLIPLKKKHRDKIVNKFKDVTSAIIFGYILAAIVQGVLGGIVFMIAGISSPILWGALMMITALIPFIGSALIWVPAFLYTLALGNIGQAVFILIAGLIISNIDNIIRPFIIGNKAQIHPVLVILGVLGGLYLFGMMGFFIGPLILALFLTFLQIYEAEKNEA